MNLQEFRKQTKDLHSNPEDGEPLALPIALILSGGQPINLDYDLDARVDQGD